jgi:hypothetical protein
LVARAAAGVASRRASEVLIANGRVTVDGKPAKLGMQVDPMLQFRVAAFQAPGQRLDDLPVVPVGPEQAIALLLDEMRQRLDREEAGVFAAGRAADAVGHPEEAVQQRRILADRHREELVLVHAPGVTDLASGHIPMMTPNVGGPLLQFHATGKVRILAIAANKRLAAAPDIPTAIEAGLPGMVAANFNGLFAPAGVPKDVIKALADETRTAMADPDIQKLLITSGFEPVLDSGPEPAQQEVASEYARWTPIIKKLGFKVQ